jgi:hypothetical protein
LPRAARREKMAGGLVALSGSQHDRELQGIAQWDDTISVAGAGRGTICVSEIRSLHAPG